MWLAFFISYKVYYFICYNMIGDYMIKEIIVVEGKEDIKKVKSAVNAEVIATGGFHYDKAFISSLKTASKNRGVIIFTDPDYAGNRIRRELTKLIPNYKHAFLSQENATLDGDIGIENASIEDIREALENCKAEKANLNNRYTRMELLDLGLTAGKSSKKRRDELAKILKIGHVNSKQLLNRLNSFDIKREDFEMALERVNKKYGK